MENEKVRRIVDNIKKAKLLCQSRGNEKPMGILYGGQK